MKLTISEEWDILDELHGGSVVFGVEGYDFSFRGYWTPEHPTNPELRAAVERQWNKMRPLAENEWRDGDIIAVFKDFNGEPRFQFVGDGDCLNPHIYTGPASRACLAWYEKHYGNTVNGYEFRMGEFGVQYRCWDGEWRIMTDNKAHNSAREWMRRKGITLKESEGQ